MPTARGAALQKENLHHRVARDIGSRILRGEFAPGDLLPNEADCCVRFGVSRTAVREAMKMLSAKGLILSRPKIGSRVQPKDSWNLLDREVLAWYGAAANQRHFLESVQQLRLIFEPEVAALAAARHKAKQLTLIEGALAAMRAARTIEQWNAADVRFHLAILWAAGNELLVPFGFVIESALGSLFDYTARSAEDMRRALPLHEAIFAAIRRRRPDEARRAVKRLLANTDRVIERGQRRAAKTGKSARNGVRERAGAGISRQNRRSRISA